MIFLKNEFISFYLLARDMMTLISLFWKFNFSSLWNCKIPKESAPKRPQIKKFVYNQLLIYFFKDFFRKNAPEKKMFFLPKNSTFWTFSQRLSKKKYYNTVKRPLFGPKPGSPIGPKSDVRSWRYVKMTSLIVLSSVIRSIITCEEIETHVPSVLRALRVHSSF